MKLLAINGSYRGHRGYTAYLIETLFEGARSAGADCEVIHLSEKKIKRCTGCFICQTDTHALSCIHKHSDDVEAIFEKMRQADLIVYATPVYVFNQSSLINQLQERFLGICHSNRFHFSKPTGFKPGLFFHHIDREVCSKPFITLICQDNLEAATHKTLHDYYTTFSRFMEAPYVGQLVRRSGGLALHGDPTALTRYPSLTAIYRAFNDAGRELATHARLSRKTMKQANQPLIQLPPFIHFLMTFTPFREKVSEKISQMM